VKLGFAEVIPAAIHDLRRRPLATPTGSFTATSSPLTPWSGPSARFDVMDWRLAKVLGEETPATAESLAAEETRA
jgi:hypothetical protein